MNVKTLAVCAAFFQACGGGKAGRQLPLVTPPVKAALPTSLGGSLSRDLARDTPPGAGQGPLGAFQSRFFSGAGPTDLLSILKSIDGTVAGVNDQLSSGPACGSQTPVPFTMQAFSDSVTFQGQCAQTISGQDGKGGGFSQFGIDSAGVAYLYTAVGAEHAAVVVTPAQASSQPSTDDAEIEAWLGVGYTNAAGMGAWDGGSYGVVHLKANAATKAFEMAVAGIGVGFCGAQLKSDGVSIYMTGSIDMGSNCTEVTTQCVSADLSTTGDCTALTTFALTPLGRKAAASSTHAQTTGPMVSSWAASQYPATPNLQFDGTSTDAMNFGPASATTGVGTLSK